MRFIFSQVPCRIAWKALLLLVAWGGAASTLANESLAKKNDCFGCHAVKVKLVGPAYKDIAAKYAGQVDAVAQLSQSIRNGSVGKWGDLPMPAHPKIPAADIKRLVTWVMSTK